MRPHVAKVTLRWRNYPGLFELAHYNYNPGHNELGPLCFPNCHQGQPRANQRWDLTTAIGLVGEMSCSWPAATHEQYLWRSLTCSSAPHPLSLFRLDGIDLFPGTTPPPALDQVVLARLTNPGPWAKATTWAWPVRCHSC